MVATLWLGGCSTLAQRTAAEIRTEAGRGNAEAEGRPLPLVSSWNCGNPADPLDAGWTPAHQLDLIAQGHRLLPWFRYPIPEGQTALSPGSPGWRYYAEPLQRARQLGLPFTLVASQFERHLSAPPWLNLPPAENPNVVRPSGRVEKVVSPLGPVGSWEELGRWQTRMPRLRQLQEWYPDPPLVLFLSNNEHDRLNWRGLEQDGRFLRQYGKGRSDEFKRAFVGAAWIERYRALQAGMREGLAAPGWQRAARFVGYNAFGPYLMGYDNDWLGWSLHVSGRFSPQPLMWDGASPSFYVWHWDETTDCTVMSPQIDCMNLVFMQREAWKLNPDFWFELSFWDGRWPGQTTDKDLLYRRWGQPYSPARYRGLAQFGMWLLRPRVLREYRDTHSTWADDEPYFMSLLEAVDTVWQDPILREFWRHGELVPNRSRQHPYQVAIPAEWAHEDRWFLLEADVNPQQAAWGVAEFIPVYALALVRGQAPRRQWLVYAHAPLGDRRDVRLEVPGYGPIRVEVTVGGSYWLLREGEPGAGPSPVAPGARR